MNTKVSNKRPLQTNQERRVEKVHKVKSTLRKSCGHNEKNSFIFLRAVGAAIYA